jgi:hypothetical protein
MSWKLIKQESIKLTNITTLLIYHIFIKDNSIRKKIISLCHSI